MKLLLLIETPDPNELDRREVWQALQEYGAICAYQERRAQQCLPPTIEHIGPDIVSSMSNGVTIKEIRE